ncbi:MAG: hypothetical protein U0Q12_11195 [Vicinamibacterales bacterium]
MNVCARVFAWVVVLAAVPAAAQIPLAEVARQEAERRRSVAGATKVYTNDDVAKSTAPLTTVATKPSGEPGAAADDREPDAARDATKDDDAQAQDAKGEAFWRGRMQQAQEELSRAKSFGEALQSRINGLTQDFASRDDYAQRDLIGKERAKAVDELARVKAEIASLTEKIAAVEDEARRAGVPPGWLR